MSESPLPAGALTIGATVGNYKILEKIGEGGMGAVYLAAHPLLGRKAAVKVLLPEHSKKADLVNRFFNEAKTTASLRHPALVEVFDFGFLPDGSGYIVMDYLEGESLARRLERVAPLAPDVAAEIARQMAAGIAAAHDQGIVHRDLKPDNVFLVPDPEQIDRERVKILDFGIAKLVLPSAPGSKGATSTGMLLGTPLFMAPEQCRGAGQVDHRADIYSVGCILYMMLTAQPPFNHEGIGEILAAHLHEPVRPPRTIDSTIPEALEAIVMRALKKLPDERQQSMAELGAELQNFLYPGIAASGPMHRPSNLMAVPRGSGAQPLAPLPTPARRSGAEPAPRQSAAATPVEAASPFAPTPQAPRPAPVIPPARGGRAGAVLVLVLLAAGGVAGGAWWLGNRWKQKLNAPRRPPATATRPPEAKPETKPVEQPPVATAEPTNPEAVPGTPDEPAKPEPEAQTEPAKPEPEAQTEPAKPEPEAQTEPAKPDPAKKPRPPVERRPSAGARAFARGMEHRGRGEEDEAMYAFEEAIRVGGMDPEMRSEAERQYINIKRKYGFIDILCDERGIDVSIDNRSRGQTPFSRPLLVRPGPHQVVLSGGGYQPKRLTVDVGPAQKTAVKCRR